MLIWLARFEIATVRGVRLESAPSAPPRPGEQGHQLRSRKDRRYVCDFSDHWKSVLKSRCQQAGCWHDDALATRGRCSGGHWVLLGVARVEQGLTHGPLVSGWDEEASYLRHYWGEPPDCYTMRVDGLWLFVGGPDSRLPNIDFGHNACSDSGMMRVAASRTCLIVPFLVGSRARHSAENGSPCWAHLSKISVWPCRS